jgi:ADP-heptose:LPS heptosyltransferase
MKNRIMAWNTSFKNTTFWNMMRYVKRWCADVIPLIVQNRTKERALLIVRLDAIGDYILFRNYLKVLRESTLFQYHHITLCGNEQWKDLAETLDGSYVDTFVWIRLDLFWNNLRYRVAKLRLLNTHGYDIVLNPVYSRKALYEDAIVRVVSANEKIGMSGDALHNPVWQKKIADRWYTKLIVLNPSTHFEVCRTKEFFEKILHEMMPTSRSHFDTRFLPSRKDIHEPYAVICPGGSAHSHQWNIVNFLKVAEYIFSAYHMTSVFVGAASEQLEQKVLNEIEQLSYIKNLIGKTTLLELVSIVQTAALAVSNETSIVHMSVAAEKPVVVISNGDRYGRFTEYPISIYDKIQYVYAPGVIEAASTFDDRVKYFSAGSNLDINLVTVLKVNQRIDKLLAQEKIRL